MGKNLSKLLLLCSVTALTATAQHIVETTTPDGLTKVTMIQSAPEVQAENVPAETTVKEVSASFKLDPAQNRTLNTSFAIGKVNGKLTKITGAKLSATADTIVYKNLEEGKWNFYAVFNGKNNLLILSAEEKNVPFESDLVFDESAADILIEVDDLLPDGSQPKLPLVNSATKETIEDGNLIYWKRETMIGHDGPAPTKLVYIKADPLMMRYLNSDGTYSTTHLANSIKTNGAKHISLSRLNAFGWKKGSVVSCHNLPFKSAKYSSKPSDYLSAEANFGSTAYYADGVVPNNGVNLMYSTIYDGYYCTWAVSNIQSQTLDNKIFNKVYFNVADFNGDAPFKIYPGISLPVAQIKTGRFSTTYAISTPPFANDKGRVAVLGMPNSEKPVTGTWGRQPDGTHRISEYNPAMSYYVDSKLNLSNSTATTVLVPATNSGTTSVTYGFTGIYGERREIDALAAKPVLTLNGDTLATTESDLKKTFDSWKANAPASGKVRLTVLNPNVRIDTLKGETFTELEYASTGLKNTPPVLQILRPMAKGKITDRFDSPSGAELVFVGGTYLSTMIGNNYYMTFGENVKAKAEYALHGNTKYTDLAVAENSDNFWMPGWGQYFSASLAGVKADKKGNWYDVRITLTDNAGNTLRHTFSPAFFMKAGDVGVNSVMDNEGISITRNGSAYSIKGTSDPAFEILDISGRRIASGNSTTVDMSDLPSGIYFVAVSDNGTRKVFKMVK